MGKKKLVIKSKGGGAIAPNNAPKDALMTHLSQQLSKNTSIDHSDNATKGSNWKPFKIKKVSIYRSPVVDKTQTPTTAAGGGRPSTPVKQSVNVANRRLRSQEAKQ